MRIMRIFYNFLPKYPSLIHNSDHIHNIVNHLAHYNKEANHMFYYLKSRG